MGNPIISIIIPVFNAGFFLADLLESILTQSFTKFEVIIVNDGSTDETKDILTYYETKDQRIKIINKKNEGVSIARNTALEYAKGEYIYFADADDLLMIDALQILFNAAQLYKADLIRADHQTIGAKCEILFTNKRFYIRKKIGNRILNTKDYYNKILLDEFFLWVCLFKRNIIINNKIRFIPHCRFMEDAAFIMEYLVQCKKCVYIPNYIYKYRIYGLTAGQTKKDYSKDLKQILEKLASFEKITYINAFKRKIKNKIVYNHNQLQKIVQIYNKILLNIKYLLCK